MYCIFIEGIPICHVFPLITVTTRATLGTFSFKRKRLCHKNMAERSVHVIVKPVLAKLIENL